MNRTSRFGPLWWTTTVWPIERPPGAPFCGVQRTPNAHRAILRRPTRAIVGPDDPTSWEARRRRRSCWPADSEIHRWHGTDRQHKDEKRDHDKRHDGAAETRGDWPLVPQEKRPQAAREEDPGDRLLLEFPRDREHEGDGRHEVAEESRPEAPGPEQNHDAASAEDSLYGSQDARERFVLHRISPRGNTSPVSGSGSRWPRRWRPCRTGPLCRSPWWQALVTRRYEGHDYQPPQMWSLTPGRPLSWGRMANATPVA